MKKAVLFAVLMGTLTLCLALSSIGMSPVLTIDTVDPEIEIFNPAGGELWYIGDSHDIQWTATDTNLMEDEIDIWYSLNGGSDYTALAMSIFNSGTQPWEIPAWQTQSAKIRVDAIDSFGNTASQNSNSFKIGYVPPAIPTGISVNITNEIDALISWDAVTHTIPPYNTPITPDGYIILYNESPYEYDEHFYYFLGRSFTTNYTHHDVAEFRDRMFYRVLAYKNYRGEENEALQRLVEKSKSQNIPWLEAKQMLLGGAQ